MFIGTQTDPKLQPGRRYYLEVRNTDPMSESDFTICVDFDKVDPNPLSVPPLANGVCLPDSIAPTNLLKYYYFDVAQCATEVIFELQRRRRI